MTHFEYILTFVSLLVGLAVADIASSAHQLLRARDRVRWDWMAPLAATLVVLLLVEFWWSYFNVGHAAAWRNYGNFLVLLVLLLVAFLLASSALPDRVPADGLDLRRFYEANASYFWTLLSLFLLLSVPMAFVVNQGRVPWLRVLGNRTPTLVLLGLTISLAIHRGRRYHTVVLPILVVVLGTLWTRMQLR